MKKSFELNKESKQISKINSITDLPKISSFLFPEGYELLPNTSELFELEFAYYECNFLKKDEVIQRGAFFKSVDEIRNCPVY